MTTNDKTTDNNHNHYQNPSDDHDQQNNPQKQNTHAKVLIYTKQQCPYCVMAKNLLKSKGVHAIEEIRIDLDEQAKDDMIMKTNRRTVPQIFIGKVHVGGFDDLNKLQNQGQLDALLLAKD